MHPLLASLPIIALITAMTTRAPRVGLPLPAHLALPAAAGLALLLHVTAATDPRAVMLVARVVEGLLTSLMPLAVVFGAVVLFRTLRESGAMDALTSFLERSVPDPILRVVLIAWSFSYLVEGLSGFGTPAALAAPLLVGLGFPAVRVAAACLVMNTVPVVFGAVGMPVWFGFGELALSETQLRSIAGSAAVLQCVAAPVVVALGLRLLFPWRELRQRAFRVFAVVAVTLAASTLTAQFSMEFPTIVGGAFGLGAALMLGGRATTHPSDRPPPRDAETRRMPPWRAAAPLVATVLLLAATRIEPLGLRGLLTAETPAASLELGNIGTFSVSPALAVRLDDIFGTGIAWSMPVLYVPFIIPFLAVALISSPLLGLSIRRSLGVWRGAASNLVLPAIALAGALVFVKLMMHGGQGAPAVAIGLGLADGVAAVHAPLWLTVAPMLGALGSFFSGSATVSNLTFAPIQAAIAERLGLEATLVLALQAIGAAMGNMVCVHNIVAVAAVLGLTRGQRSETGRTVKDKASADSGDDPVASILGLNARPLAGFAIVAALAAVVLGAV